MVLALLLWPGRGDAQTYLTRTTLTRAVTSSESRIFVAAATDLTVGAYAYVDRELMRITAVRGTTADVQRGYAGGGAASAHAAGTLVHLGPGAAFASTDATGSCTATAERSLPHINTTTGRLWDCEGGTWLARRRDPVFVRDHTVRDSFDGAYFVHQDDLTAQSLDDDEDNIVHGSPLGLIEYREELGKTASSWVTSASGLDVSADDVIDNEGVEILFGSVETGVWAIAGTQGGCFAASLTVADVSGTDQVQLGFRNNAALPNAAAYTALTVWNSVGINAADGSIVSSQEVSEATATDDSGVDWADGETRALKVCVSHAGVPSAFYADAYTHSPVIPDAPNWRAITMTETGSTLTAATALTPFFSYLAAGTDGADVVVHWVELTRLP